MNAHHDRNKLNDFKMIHTLNRNSFHTSVQIARWALSATYQGQNADLRLHDHKETNTSRFIYLQLGKQAAPT